MLVALATRAESITFELYDVSRGGAPALLAKGVHQYTVRDVLVTEYDNARDGAVFPRWWVKEIRISSGFSIGASIFRERELVGFGLWLKDRGSFLGRIASGGFSWDWFNQDSGLIYRKLQGTGLVRVSLAPSAQFKEITSIEVLEDMMLRANNRPWFFFSDGDTHHLVIRKGSVLRFAP